MGTRSNQVLGKEGEEEDDVFSRFTDEFIVDELLTRLSFKEAVRTSVLSRRWKKLWTHRSFIFDSECLDDDDPSSDPNPRQKFVQIVNGCLELHQNPTLRILRIEFDLDHGFSSIVNGWLQFAFRKGVQRLELSLRDGLWFSEVGRNDCVFPGVDTLKKHLSTNLSFNLRIFSLTGLDINQEALEYLLSKSPFLEELYLRDCDNLIDLNVPSRARSLKSLMVNGCREMKRLAISKSNLTSLTLSGSKITLSLENVPLLSSLSIDENHCDIFSQRCSLHSSLLSQLKILILHISKKTFEQSDLLTQEVPELSNLEHLHVTMRRSSGLCLLWPTILVKAAPFLHKFSVQFDPLDAISGAAESRNIDPMYELNRRRLQEISKYTHQCLRVVELKYFVGSKNQMELGDELLRVGKSLDKLVLEVPRWPSKGGLEILVDKHVNDLRSKLPSGAELIIYKARE